MTRAARRTIVHAERRIDINGATLRLDIEPLGHGQVRIVKAMRLLPGAERAQRARSAEVTAHVSQLHLDPDTTRALMEAT